MLTKDNIDVERFNQQFQLSENQIRRFLEWQETLPEAYFGADSNGISFEFPQCSLGYIVIAKRREGEKIDLTEWEHF